MPQSAGYEFAGWQSPRVAHTACPTARSTYARCLALVVEEKIHANVVGWQPADFQARYNLPSSSKGTGQIVAIVDAYDNPNVASDLNEYRSEFGLGAADFTKYNQDGEQGNYPGGSTGWGVEIDLDVEMVSATCPKCTIYLIEANSAAGDDLQAAETEAAKLGAHVISNSWICYGSISCVEPGYFDRPHILYVAAAGNAGYDDPSAPQAFASVVSVGGTVMSKNGSQYSEAAWANDNSGCAEGVAKPKWQHDPDCSYRTYNDMGAVAWDVAGYDTYGYGGWLTAGGTSIAASLIAGVYGLAGNARKQHAAEKLWTLNKKQLAKDLHAIGSGSDGACKSYLCQDGTGQYGQYGGPTGWGTPNGVGAF
jgi:subtilase family serine protease